jgi:tetratricopeptide (TPR) repeat protein
MQSLPRTHRFPNILLLLAWLFLLGLPGPVHGETEQEGQLQRLQEGTVGQRRASLKWLADYGRAGAVPAVLEKLKDADRESRVLAEFALWAIWARSGDPEVDRLLKTGTVIMTQGDPREAITVFTEIIQRKPDFAEAYNKRATAWYMLGAYERSLADVRATLQHNPSHFGALSGAGFCLIRLKRFQDAAFFLERALRINPNLDTVRALWKKLDTGTEHNAA